ncbi:MAG: type IV toxin-antitoxin system AbiEi family antitoxin [Bacteroidales bacterium]|nr:type IV toxin-antitoxin system AbiEi family antitoxin [Bacteroidales bacterium]
MNINETSLNDWITQRVLRGKYFFSINDIEESFTQKTHNYLRTDLNRLTKRGVIMSPCRNFYVAVPEEYRLKGVVPPVLYIDNMMSFMGKPYYVALLSAAALHGAAHQAPQAFMVITNDKMRSVVKNGTRWDFVTRKYIPTAFLIKKRSKSGDFNVSSPALTAIDLIEYEANVGGLSRATEVLAELLETIDFKSVDDDFYKIAQTPIYQRLGYILEEVLDEKAQADTLYDGCKNAGLTFRKTPLKKGRVAEQESATRWKIQENITLEIDEL